MANPTAAQELLRSYGIAHQDLTRRQRAADLPMKISCCCIALLFVLAVPARGQGARNCTDIEGFKDEKGYTCTTWKYTNCSEAVSRWGYTAEGEAAVLANCSASCGECAISSSPPPVAYPPPATVEAGCADTEGFKDEKGYTCTTWKYTNCSEAVSRWGYTAEGEAAVLANCSASCGECTISSSPPPVAYPPPATVEAGCADTEGFKDEKGYSCTTWKYTNCSEAVSRWGYTAEGEAAVLANCSASCGECTISSSPPPVAYPPPATVEAGCADTEGFKDEKGYTCTSWKSSDCSEAVSRWGYTAEGEADLLANCSATCGVCGVSPPPPPPPSPSEGCSTGSVLVEVTFQTRAYASNSRWQIIETTSRNVAAAGQLNEEYKAWKEYIEEVCLTAAVVNYTVLFNYYAGSDAEVHPPRCHRSS
ncbi:hypothetical protein CYMTET_11674 [Cymbomonas tetramitiformis]|uniref:ShKT domain-containing protein n=1 Tax=Cymbomonas tetramitiformis TaxID=36881 RepID=A0AAE0LCL9_9CHLO|nr:hypothetical protein CYMTET_11674 [Cymbomonas tetramitiformis]